MKPTEIIDEYSDTDENIVNHLKKKGYKFLGQGVDQTAFLEPGGQTVLKIFGTQPEARAPKGNKGTPTFSQDHMMFFRWAKYCNKHSDNPFLPKFSGAESFYWNKQVYLQIRQELLFKLDSDIASVLATMADLADDGYDFKDALDEMSSYHNDDVLILKDKIGMKGIKLLYKTLLKLKDIAYDQNWILDLHEDNFMARADGAPVIVDPWVV